jgi:hypothetical protein
MARRTINLVATGLPYNSESGFGIKSLYIRVCDIRLNIVGFEVLTAVAMKISILWDITPCSPLKVNRSFGEHGASMFRAKE